MIGEKKKASEKNFGGKKTPENTRDSQENKQTDHRTYQSRFLNCTIDQSHILDRLCEELALLRSL